MKLTLSVIKADIGSICGHTQPSNRMLHTAQQLIQESKQAGLIIDGTVTHTGDDVALIVSHTHGDLSKKIHQRAWEIFLTLTDIAKESGLYGAGQDLLADAPSANVRGAGPGVAELTFDHTLSGDRPAESFMVFTADKCGPGAYNLPLFLSFADPMYCAGLMLPKMMPGFSFQIIDMNNTDGDMTIELHAPEDIYKITALLRDNERFGIQKIYARGYDHEPVVAVTADRLHSIAGTYTGKDDPAALVRVQGIFPAPEEILSPFAKAHYIGGDARGSHNMPLMPVAINTAVTGMYCLPIVSAIGFSVDAHGAFSHDMIDFFDNPAWDYVRLKAQKKAIEMRSQGWSGPAMLPYTELEYSGFKDSISALLQQFKRHDQGK